MISGRMPGGKTHEETDNPYEALAAAIVKQAVADYITACRIQAGKRREYVGESSNHRMVECERFFNSEWAMALTDMDLPSIAQMIRKEVIGDERQDE